MATQLLHIKLSDISANKVALRDVNISDEKVQGLVESIKVHGILNPINVMPDRESPGRYVLIDGRHRRTAAELAGLKEIPCQVLEGLSDAQVMIAQIVANIHKIETSPVQYTEHLKRVMYLNPTMTKSELAELVGQSESWIKTRLSLEHLHPDVLKLVDDSSIGLSNAYALARLPEGAQLELAEVAQVKPPNEFLGIANAKAKEIRAKARQERPDGPAEWVPPSHLRTKAEIEAELKSGAEAAEICRNLTTAEQGFKAGLNWAMHLDDASVAAAKAKDEARKAEAKAKADARNAERQKLKEELAKQKAEAVGI